MAFALILYSCQYVFLKYLVVVVFKHMVPLVDDFFAIFLPLMNISIATLLAGVNLHQQSTQVDVLKYKGFPDSIAKYTPLEFRY